MRNTVRLILAGLLFVGCTACMKYRCYECKDQAGVIVEKGCDKKYEEVETLGESRNWNCTVLPD